MERPLASELLAWYRATRRDLPWRATRDPYAIWISEVMLQQTRVETVRPYYARFLARFPDVGSLASAPLSDVLGAWSGLGYYRRARALHAAAAEVAARHGGTLPSTVHELRELPGFGPYTAAAVASIAFGRDEALVDGNVARVLSRISGRDLDARVPRERAELQAMAQGLLPPGEAGDFNQALMELGAVVCTPGEPACASCPVTRACAAFATGRQRELPGTRARRARPVLHVAALVARRGERVLLARRPEQGLFGGLWELPASPAGDDPRRAAAVLAAALGLDDPAPLGRVEQTLTHRELVLDLFAVRAPPRWRPRAPEPYLEARFVDPAGGIGIASVTRKALRAAAAGAEEAARLGRRAAGGSLRRRT